MQLEHYDITTLKQELREIIGLNFDLSTHRLFFFGSRLMGTHTERSDIDVGIEGYLALTPETLAAIQEDLGEIQTLYTIEVVDFRAVSSKFRHVASARELITPAA